MLARGAVSVLAPVQRPCRCEMNEDNALSQAECVAKAPNSAYTLAAPSPGAAAVGVLRLGVCASVVPIGVGVGAPVVVGARGERGCPSGAGPVWSSVRGWWGIKICGGIVDPRIEMRLPSGRDVGLSANVARHAW
jgi:hypothetical protein